MTDIKETGGARIGIANATWPFATLRVTKDKLELNASVIGNLVFAPNDIVSIVPQDGSFGKGLRIIHKVPTYKDNVFFWTFKNPNELLKRIEKTGFLTNNSPLSAKAEDEILYSQSKGGFPIKFNAIIVFGIIWNIFFILNFKNFITGDKQSSPLGTGALIALSFAFMTGVLILTVEPFRKLILKDGRTLNDIKRFVYFMMFISGLMILLIAFTN
jgi:hypothetical protein